MSEELDVLIKIGGKFYEGKLHPQQLGQHPQISEPKRCPTFPEPYAEMVEVTDQGTYWKVRPRTFLQTSDFAEIARIVKEHNGEYVSAGKASHFRIPK
jgi:hypothetical protein